jgi:hypothetical protein
MVLRLATIQGADGRQQEAIEFFMGMVRLCEKIGKGCIENPVGIMSTIYRPPDQYIQPWQFGEDASKKTGLWLFGLPPLTPTKIIPPTHPDKDGNLTRYANQTPGGQNKLGPSPDRAKLRSRTYQGIADAMASQWG